MAIKIGIIKERRDGDGRVSVNVDGAKKLIANAFELLVEKKAGQLSGITDSEYVDAGATVCSPNDVIKKSDVLISINPLPAKKIASMAAGSIYIGYVFPHKNTDLLKAFNAKKITAFALEMIPRITRAQAMDSLSSQAAISGYKAAIRGADLAPRFFPMLTYAAGTIRPAKVVVIGTGVAGLQAIATAKRLGAVVEAYDIRPETREQVESLGGKFIDTQINANAEGGYARQLTAEEINKQAEVLSKHLAKAHIVISTASVPGRPAPKIITEKMVKGMQNGSVIIDIAAENGGNCDLTKADKTITSKNGVIIDGPVNLAAQMPIDASDMIAKNILNIMPLLSNGKKIEIDLSDEILQGALLTHEGETIHEQFASKTKAAVKAAVKTTETKTTKKASVKKDVKPALKNNAKSTTKKTKVAKKTAKPKAAQKAEQDTKTDVNKTADTVEIANSQSLSTETIQKDVQTEKVKTAKNAPSTQTVTKKEDEPPEPPKASSSRKKIDGKDEVLTGKASQWLQGR